MSVMDMYDSMLTSTDDKQPTLWELLDSSRIEEPILAQTNQLLETMGFKTSIQSEIGREFNHTYCMIESNVGDDANVTTDSFCYGAVTLCAASHISFIKLSMKDIGMSKTLANYAEGWMLTPPTANSSFEAVNRYAKGSGMPFTLDPVKLKFLSAVQIRRNDYLALCLLGVREAYELRTRGEKRPRRLHEVPYYNYIMDVEWLLPQEAVSAILEGYPGQWRRLVTIKLLYDVPNMERGLERTKYRQETNTITVLGGGYLQRLTTDTLPEGKAWAELPIRDIALWDDFSLQRRRNIHARRVRVTGAANFVVSPRRMGSTRSIRDWLRSVSNNPPITVAV